MVSVLGVCTLVHPGREPRELSPSQRRLLARLALEPGTTVSPDALVVAVWGDEPPRTARAALLNQISRVRAHLEALGASGSLPSIANGYELRLTTDASQLEDAVSVAEVELRAGHAGAAFEAADGALRRWRGVPFEDLEHLDEAAAARRRLAELRLSAENLRLRAALDDGRWDWAVPEAERLVAAAPFDERRWSTLAEALELAGRRGDALAVFERARRSLREGLGLEPGPMLLAAERATLEIPERPAVEHAPLVFGLDAVLASVAHDVEQGCHVVLTGEEGAGASRLLDALTRRLRSAGRRVAHVRCRTHPDRAGAVLVDLLDELGWSLDALSGPVDGFLAAVRRGSAHDGVVLLVDDVHLAGPTSLAVLAETSAIEGVTLAVTSRGVDPLPWTAIVHRIPPLDRSAVAVLAADRLGVRRSEDDPIVGWLAELCGGNPHLLECILDDAHVADRWRDGGRGERPARTGATVVAGVVRRRLEAQGALAREAVEVAAACGPDVPRRLLDDLAPKQGVDDAFRAGLLVESGDGSVGFRHGAVRQVVLSDLPPGRLAELRHAGGIILESGGAPAARVASLLEAAAELDLDRAIDAAKRAAADATARGAHRDAAAWYGRAIAIAAPAGSARRHDRIELSIARGDALRLAGDPAHVEVLLEAAEEARLLGAPELLAQAAFALLQLGSTTESGAPHQAAVDLAERAMDAARDDQQRAVVAAAASLACSLAGDAERCRTLFLDAEGWAIDPTVRRQVLPFAYLGLGLPGDLDRREVLTDELLHLGRSCADPVATFEGLHLAFSVALQRADGPRARAALGEMDELVEVVGDVGRRWALLYQHAAIAHLDDDLERCEALATEAMALFGRVAASRAFAAYGSQLLVVRLAQGRLVELQPVVADLCREQPGVPAWHAALSAALVPSDPERALHHADEALRHVQEDFTWLAAHVIGARAAAALGHPPTVEEYLRRLAPWEGLVCWQGTCSYGPVATPLALLCRSLGDAAGERRYGALAAGLSHRLEAPVFLRELLELGVDGAREVP